MTRPSDPFAGLLRLHREEEVRDFLSDLCTPGELQQLCDRWVTAKLLHMGFSYRIIVESTGAGSSTVARVTKPSDLAPREGNRAEAGQKDVLSGTGEIQTGCASGT